MNFTKEPVHTQIRYLYGKNFHIAHYAKIFLPEVFPLYTIVESWQQPCFVILRGSKLKRSSEKVTIQSVPFQFPSTLYKEAVCATYHIDWLELWKCHTHSLPPVLMRGTYPLKGQGLWLLDLTICPLHCQIMSWIPQKLIFSFVLPFQSSVFP